MNLPTATYKIIYNQKDISEEIRDEIISVTYKDAVVGESDTIEVEVADPTRKWLNSWYPDKGAKVQLVIYSEGSQLNCGTFEIDEPTYKHSRAGRFLTLKGIACGITRSLRTKRSQAHDDKSLREIASTVASKHHLKVIGNIPDIRVGRETQHRETDLAFLKRIGSDYGCIFSVREDKLVFTYYKDIEGKSPVFTVRETDVIDLQIADTTHKTFKSVKVKHHNSKSKEVIEYDEDFEDSEGGEDSADDLEIRTRVENKQQAEAKGKHALSQANTKAVSGTISVSGNLLFVSGNNLKLDGYGKLDGTYHIEEAEHKIDKQGAYSSSGDIKRVKKA
jgi:uncharacterized protein